MLYQGLKGAASIPANDLVLPIRRTRNHHSLTFQTPLAGTDIYKSRKKNPQKLTQLSSRSHPRHLVGKRTAQLVTITDITSDSQVNKSSFSPRDWNSLTDSLVSASECVVDSITKLTSLVRARD